MVVLGLFLLANIALDLKSGYYNISWMLADKITCSCNRFIKIWLDFHPFKDKEHRLAYLRPLVHFEL